MQTSLPIPIGPVFRELREFSQDQVSPKEREDKLHNDIRGEEFEFAIEREENACEAYLRIQNLVVDQDFNVQVGMRVGNYECPSDIDDWGEDIRFLYQKSFRNSPEERGDPLLSEINIMGVNSRDIEIGAWVNYSTQSAIWTATRRFARCISEYHRQYFQLAKEEYEKFDDCDTDWQNDNIPMTIGTRLFEDTEGWSLEGAYGYILEYGRWKSN